MSARTSIKLLGGQKKRFLESNAAVVLPCVGRHRENIQSFGGGLGYRRHDREGISDNADL